MFRSMLVALTLLGLASAPPPGGQDAPKKNAAAHSPDCPRDCKTCAASIDRAMAYLTKHGGTAGFWSSGNGGSIVTTVMAGLAYMAAGSTPTSGPNAKIVGNIGKGLLTRMCGSYKSKMKSASGAEFDGMANWDIGFAAWYLGYYHKFTKNPADITKLEWLAQQIEDNREPNHGWGHGKGVAYGDLVVASTACMLGLGSLRDAGIKVNPRVIEEGMEYYVSTAGKEGQIGYSPREGQKGWGKAGRSSGAACAMLLNGLLTHPQFLKTTDFIRANIPTAVEDHCSPNLHLFFSGIYAYTLGPQAWRAYRDAFHDKWFAAQAEDGSVPMPWAGDVGDMDNGTVGINYTTAVFALVWQLPKDQCPATRLPEWLTDPKENKGKKPWLGVQVASAEGGIKVTGLASFSPARLEGVEPGDIVTDWGKTPLATPEALAKELEQVKPGQKASLRILRNGKKKTFSIELLAHPDGIENFFDKANGPVY